MPDTGENHEIRQRVNAREAEIASETSKLVREEKAELKNLSSCLTIARSRNECPKAINERCSACAQP
jgi:hypothetical protein